MYCQPTRENNKEGTFLQVNISERENTIPVITIHFFLEKERLFSAGWARNDGDIIFNAPEKKRKLATYVKEAIDALKRLNLGEKEMALLSAALELDCFSGFYQFPLSITAHFSMYNSKFKNKGTNTQNESDESSPATE